MRIRAILILGCVFALLGLAATAWAEKENVVESERWHAIYYKGDKVGMAHEEFTDWTEGGDKYRKIESKGYVKVRGVATDDRRRKVDSVAYTVGGKSKHEVLFKNGVVIEYEAKHTGSRQPTMKAEGEMEGGVLVLKRKEGPTKNLWRVGKSDYDLTSDPASMEPFLETVGGEKVEKMVFAFSDGKIKKTSFLRKKDGETLDVDGVKKPAKVYKLEDEEYKSTVKTIGGKVVYFKRTKKTTKNSLVSRMTTEEKAKSDSGH